MISKCWYSKELTKEETLSHGILMLTRLAMILYKIFILKLVAVDALATSSVTPREVTTLAHEIRNDAVEDRALVAKAFLTSAQSTEILCNMEKMVMAEIHNYRLTILTGIKTIYVLNFSLTSFCLFRSCFSAVHKHSSHPIPPIAYLLQYTHLAAKFSLKL